MVTLPGGRPSSSSIQLPLMDHPSETAENYFQQSSNSASASSNNGFCSSSAPKNGGDRKSVNNVKTDFWRMPDQRGNFRPIKRHAIVSNGEPEESAMCSQPKIRLTEEKMLARLRNFHITSASDNVDSGWFFMQKPMEMFDDIENRMSDDEDEIDKTFVLSRNNVSPNAETDMSDDDLSQDQRDTLAISGMLKKILEADAKRVAIASQTVPNPCTDIVLWKPPGDFVKEIMNTSSSDKSESSEDFLSQASFEHFYDTSMADTVPSQSSSGTEVDDFSDIALYQRRNARQYSKPIIDVFSLPAASAHHIGGDNELENGTSNDANYMMEIDE